MQTRMIRPEYAERFRCIGPACEDTCCAGWTVTVDEASRQKYLDLPAGPLRSLMETAIVPAANGKPETDSSATIRMLPSGDCPFLSPQRLCRIQVEHGEGYLCRTCQNFPRRTHTIDGLTETDLSLSCPEAARLILLERCLLAPAGASGYHITWDPRATSEAGLKGYFWQIREFVVTLIQNRRYPLWQRMFLLGSFSRRLDALVRGDMKRSFPDVLNDFSRAVAERELSAAMEIIPANPELQLRIVVQLIAQRAKIEVASPRLRDVLDMFVKCVGISGKASTDRRVTRYVNIDAQFCEPFFRRRPHILENYLIHAVFRDFFPFGLSLFDAKAKPEPARAFAMLAIQFALLRGLLIGVAGARGRKFNTADVIRTVETVSKHFEHNRSYFPQAYTTLAAKGLDNAHGLTMLFRN